MRVFLFTFSSLFLFACGANFLSLRITHSGSLNNKTMYVFVIESGKIGQDRKTAYYELVGYNEIIYFGLSGYAYVLTDKPNSNKLGIKRLPWRIIPASRHKEDAKLCIGERNYDGPDCYFEVKSTGFRDQSGKMPFFYINNKGRWKPSERTFVELAIKHGDSEQLVHVWHTLENERRRDNIKREVEILKALGLAWTAIQFLNDPEKTVNNAVAMEIVKSMVGW